MITPEALEIIVSKMQQNGIKELHSTDKDKELVIKLKSQSLKNVSHEQEQKVPDPPSLSPQPQERAASPSPKEIIASFVGIFHFSDFLRSLKPGGSIKKGDLMGTIEAGTFSRDVLSTVDGTCKTISVTEKQRVEYGSMLVELQ